ncbi:uncharacterized protein LY89DRAFT_714600 [Mollisia scopiformis]|uniref:Uncharacterized protein n=1 Tax=Mollisia scopiformis TaxID=149040 RepID=A0A194XS78_MOLSC|nr:uncharacterized protein LY89DRAFT_714600 [Mollisia scopiformis]KUJ22899.1 hypothetical protein LY89DRAFT_714600 [Mollisia scopiformis]
MLSRILFGALLPLLTSATQTVTLTVTATQPLTVYSTQPASTLTVQQTLSPITVYITQTDLFTVSISTSTKTKTTTLTVTASNVSTLPLTTIQITQTLPPNTIVQTYTQAASTIVLTSTLPASTSSTTFTQYVTVNQTVSAISISTTTLKTKTKTLTLSASTLFSTVTSIAATPCYATSTPDMILNGGFEEDDAGWTFYEYGTTGATSMTEVQGTVSNPAYEGNYMLGVEFLSNNNPGIGIISPTFNSPPAYNLSFAVRVDAQNSDTTGCQGWLYSGTGDSPIDDWSQMDLSKFTGQTTWVTYSAIFQGGILEDTIEIDIDSCLNGPVWYFDSFIVVAA